tara:strand:- start:1547 stop:1714 length:168 start_codon:yes stop_codon:yes gene_type:complete
LTCPLHCVQIGDRPAVAYLFVAEIVSKLYIVHATGSRHYQTNIDLAIAGLEYLSF